MAGERAAGDRYYWLVLRAIQWGSWAKACRGSYSVGVDYDDIRRMIRESGAVGSYVKKLPSPAVIELRIEILRADNHWGRRIESASGGWAAVGAKAFCLGVQAALAFQEEEVVTGIKDLVARVPGMAEVTVDIYRTNDGSFNVRLGGSYNGMTQAQTEMLLRLAVRGHQAALDAAKVNERTEDPESWIHAVDFREVV